MSAIVAEYPTTIYSCIDDNCTCVEGTIKQEVQGDLVKFTVTCNGCKTVVAESGPIDSKDVKTYAV